MKERPILFSGPMVRALLEGRKTVTRRIVKLAEFQPSDTRGYDWTFRNRRGCWAEYQHEDFLKLCPYGQPGDRLWVRERMRVLDIVGAGGQPGAHAIRVQYEADRATSEWISYPDRLIGRPVACKCLAYGGFREASRLSLEITGVKVERLQDITEEQAEAEGVEWENWEDTDDLNLTVCGTAFRDYTLEGDAEYPFDNARDSFRSLWESINGTGSWDLNPYVWAVSFKRVSP